MVASSGRDDGGPSAAAQEPQHFPYSLEYQLLGSGNLLFRHGIWACRGCQVTQVHHKAHRIHPQPFLSKRGGYNHSFEIAPLFVEKWDKKAQTSPFSKKPTWLP